MPRDFCTSLKHVMFTNFAIIYEICKKGPKKKSSKILVAEKLDYQFYFHNKTVSPTFGLHDFCSQIIK